jgi:hypothetical protein
MCSSWVDRHDIVIHKRCSISNLPCVIKFVWEFITALEGAHLFHIYVIFNINLEHIAVIFPSLHMFKNYVIPISLLNSKPFMNNHFHFLIIVELVTPDILLQCLNVTFWTCSLFTFVLNVLGQLMWSLSWMTRQLFCNCCIIFWDLGYCSRYSD